MSNQTIELKYPREHNGAEVTSLSMRRPTVRDLLAVERQDSQDQRKRVQRSDLEKAVECYANLCEVSPDFIESLDAADFKQVDELYESFLS